MPETHKVFKSLPISTEEGQSLWMENIEEAHRQINSGLEFLEFAIGMPVPTSVVDVVEVGPEDPDYDKETPESLLAWQGRLIAKSANSKSPFLSLAKAGTYPHNAGKTKRKVS